MSPYLSRTSPTCLHLPQNPLFCSSHTSAPTPAHGSQLSGEGPEGRCTVGETCQHQGLLCPAEGRGDLIRKEVIGYQGWIQKKKKTSTPIPGSPSRKSCLRTKTEALKMRKSSDYFRKSAKCGSRHVYQPPCPLCLLLEHLEHLTKVILLILLVTLNLHSQSCTVSLSHCDLEWDFTFLKMMKYISFTS